MFGIGEERYDDEGEVMRRGVSPEAVEQAERSRGVIPLHLLLLRKVRYFTDGLVVGSREYVDEFHEKARAAELLPKRKRDSGARKMRDGEWDQMHSFREIS